MRKLGIYVALLIVANGLLNFAWCQKASFTKLYNGISLPCMWPPSYKVPTTPQDMPVPYLVNKPAIIPIDVGRQLFVDDFLIAKTSLVRHFHYPVYSKANPIIEPIEDWEFSKAGFAYAAPFSDGVWYDELENKFKMWYSTGGGAINDEVERFNALTAYAISDDGVHWVKPKLNVVMGTNIVDTSKRDSNSMWLDKEEKDPAKRYKLFNVQNTGRDKRWRYILKYSSDGIHWSKGIAQSGDMYDRSTVFFNPFRQKWVFSQRSNTNLGRSRNYLENSDPELGVSLSHRSFEKGVDKFNVFWFGPWKNELRHPDPTYNDIQPAIYNLDAIAYESLLLGFFSVWQGPENDVCDSLGIHKRNEIAIGYSRDGFHWHRPDMNRFHPVDETKNSWNEGNIQSVVGSPLIVGDSLYFYMSGRRTNKVFWDAGSNTGLATMRRDGFASLDAGKDGGVLETEAVTFGGRYLFLNTDVSKGRLLVEILDEEGKVLPGFSSQDFIPVSENSTAKQVQLRNGGSLVSLIGKPVRFRFYITNGSIFSFWVSKYKSGESEGYTSGGGPGLNPIGKDIPVQSR